MPTEKQREMLLDVIVTNLHETSSKWFTDQGKVLFAKAAALKIVDAIPTFILQKAADVSDGISQDEIKMWKQDLITIINGRIDLPFVPETVEATIIEPLVDVILKAAQEGLSLVEFTSSNLSTEADQ